MHIGVLIIKLNTNERMLLVLVLTKPNATHRFKIRIIYVPLLILYLVGIEGN